MSDTPTWDALFGEAMENAPKSKKPEVQSIACDHIGLTMDGATVTKHSNHDGQPYYKAVAKIGTIFGSEVDGQCEGIGRTPKEALQRLKEDERKLADSLWWSPGDDQSDSR